MNAHSDMKAVSPGGVLTVEKGQNGIGKINKGSTESKRKKSSQRVANKGKTIKESKSKTKPSSNGNVRQKTMSPVQTESIIKTRKRLRTENSENPEPPVISTSDNGESPKKKKKNDTYQPPKLKGDVDIFCWRCHKDGSSTVSCRICPRVFHMRCARLETPPSNDWMCQECATVLRAENVETRSEALRSLTIEQFSKLLRFVIQRMRYHEGSAHFDRPVDLEEYPQYRDFVIKPMDLTTLESNIKNQMYGSTEAFLADTKWLVHNSIIFNSVHSDLTTFARAMVKIAKQETEEIENCPDCYKHAHTLKENLWFIEPCRRPHILIWAKLKGFPYWPGKVMRSVGSTVDVRFFGDHNRAWVPMEACFLYSKEIPASVKNRKLHNLDSCVQEVEDHIKKLMAKYGHFTYFPFRTVYNPKKNKDLLSEMLPNYNESILMPKSEESAEDFVGGLRKIELIIGTTVSSMAKENNSKSEPITKTELTVSKKRKFEGSNSGPNSPEKGRPSPNREHSSRGTDASAGSIWGNKNGRPPTGNSEVRNNGVKGTGRELELATLSGDTKKCTQSAATEENFTKKQVIPVSTENVAKRAIKSGVEQEMKDGESTDKEAQGVLNFKSKSKVESVNGTDIDIKRKTPGKATDKKIEKKAIDEKTGNKNALKDRTTCHIENVTKIELNTINCVDIDTKSAPTSGKNNQSTLKEGTPKKLENRVKHKIGASNDTKALVKGSDKNVQKKVIYENSVNDVKRQVKPGTSADIKTKRSSWKTTCENGAIVGSTGDVAKKEVKFENSIKKTISEKSTDTNVPKEVVVPDCENIISNEVEAKHGNSLEGVIKTETIIGNAELSDTKAKPGDTKSPRNDEEINNESKLGSCDGFVKKISEGTLSPALPKEPRVILCKLNEETISDYTRMKSPPKRRLSRESVARIFGVDPVLESLCDDSEKLVIAEEPESEERSSEVGAQDDGTVEDTGEKETRVDDSEVDTVVGMSVPPIVKHLKDYRNRMIYRATLRKYGFNGNRKSTVTMKPYRSRLPSLIRIKSPPTVLNDLEQSDWKQEELPLLIEGVPYEQELTSTALSDCQQQWDGQTTKFEWSPKMSIVRTPVFAPIEVDTLTLNDIGNEDCDWEHKEIFDEELCDKDSELTIDDIISAVKESKTKQEIITVLEERLTHLDFLHRTKLKELHRVTSMKMKEMKLHMMRDMKDEFERLKQNLEEEAFTSQEKMKRKQWCNVCLAEAKFHCCFGTSYCDTACQEADWSTHMRVCTQYKIRAGGSDIRLSASFKKLFRTHFKHPQQNKEMADSPTLQALACFPRLRVASHTLQSPQSVLSVDGTTDGDSRVAGSIVDPVQQGAQLLSPSKLEPKQKAVDHQHVKSPQQKATENLAMKAGVFKMPKTPPKKFNTDVKEMGISRRLSSNTNNQTLGVQSENNTTSCIILCNTTKITGIGLNQIRINETEAGSDKMSGYQLSTKGEVRHLDLPQMVVGRPQKVAQGVVKQQQCLVVNTAPTLLSGGGGKTGAKSSAEAKQVFTGSPTVVSNQVMLPLTTINSVVAQTLDGNLHDTTTTTIAVRPEVAAPPSTPPLVVGQPLFSSPVAPELFAGLRSQPDITTQPVVLSGKDDLVVPLTSDMVSGKLVLSGPSTAVSLASDQQSQCLPAPVSNQLS